MRSLRGEQTESNSPPNRGAQFNYLTIAGCFCLRSRLLTARMPIGKNVQIGEKPKGTGIASNRAMRLLATSPTKTLPLLSTATP